MLTSEFALENPSVTSRILNCSSAILLLSETKCDIDTGNNTDKVGHIPPPSEVATHPCYTKTLAWLSSPVLL